MSPSPMRQRPISPAKVVTVEPPKVICGRPRSMADRKHDQPVGRPHPWSNPFSQPTSPTYASGNMQSTLKVVGDAPMQSTYRASFKTRSTKARDTSPVAARIRTPLDSGVMGTLLAVSGGIPATKEAQIEKVEWKPQTRKRVDHLEQSPEVRFAGRKLVPAPEPRGEVQLRGKAVFVDRVTNATTSHESPLGPEWKTLRRAPATVCEAKEAIKYVPPPPAPARSMTPGHHLAVSRPLWDPEVTVKPRSVVPEHLRPSSVLRIGEVERDQPRRRGSLSDQRYNPITHAGQSQSVMRSRPIPQANIHTPLW